MAVKGNASLAYSNFSELWPNFCIEAASIYTQVCRRIAMTNEAGKNLLITHNPQHPKIS
jgi:hypothetical protein